MCIRDRVRPRGSRGPRDRAPRGGRADGRARRAGGAVMPLAYYSLAAAEDFWTEHWGRQDPGELLAVAERSPLTELLVSRLPSHGLVLEAGCGLGQYVTYFRRRGYAAVGADWSARALATGR